MTVQAQGLIDPKDIVCLILWVRKEQRVPRELGMSNYGGGHNPKAMRRKNTWKGFMQLSILGESIEPVEVTQGIILVEIPKEWGI